MPHEPLEPSVPELVAVCPSAAVRERVLGACRREIAARAASERRRRRAAWSLAAAVAILLAVNSVEEQRMAARCETLVRGGGTLVNAPRPTPAVIAAWRARTVLLAGLLRDPHAL